MFWFFLHRHKARYTKILLFMDYCKPTELTSQKKKKKFRVKCINLMKINTLVLHTLQKKRSLKLGSDNFNKFTKIFAFLNIIYQRIQLCEQTILFNLVRMWEICFIKLQVKLDKCACFDWINWCDLALSLPALLLAVTREKKQLLQSGPLS